MIRFAAALVVGLSMFGAASKIGAGDTSAQTLAAKKKTSTFEYTPSQIITGQDGPNPVDTGAFSSLGGNGTVPLKTFVTITDIIVTGVGSVGVAGNPPYGVRISRIENDFATETDLFPVQILSGITGSIHLESGIRFGPGTRLKLSGIGPITGTIEVHLRGSISTK